MAFQTLLLRRVLGMDVLDFHAADTSCVKPMRYGRRKDHDAVDFFLYFGYLLFLVLKQENTAQVIFLRDAG